jgi:signal transduction histidine kinase
LGRSKLNTEPVEYQFLLAILRPSRGERRLALGTVLILLALFVLTAPFRAIQLPSSPAFIAAFQTMLLVNDLITATLLFAQFSILRWRSLLVLASGYLFTALIAIPYALTFPGLFSPTGLLGATYQTAGWLYLFWHAGLPLAAIGYALLETTDRREKPLHGSTRDAIGLSVAIVITIVLGLTSVAITEGEALPFLFSDAVHITPFGKQISATLALLNIIALGLMWSRQRSVLGLWVMVVLWAWLLEIGFFVLLTAIRFSLAFYASRVYAVVTASIVLLVLLSENVTFYARLGRSMVMQRREREGRLLSMDVMSAAIAHEINQPLTAIVANADVGLISLAKRPPNLDLIHDALTDIAAEGSRVHDAIQAVRAMFKNKKEPGATLLEGGTLFDGNELIRETIALLRSELDGAEIMVLLDLDPKLPFFFAHRGQLQQVMINLVNNGVDAMRNLTERARLLRIETKPLQASNLEVKIADSGPGIKSENTSRIFDPFFTTKPNGMGMGLAICRTIVEAHGGTLSVSPNVRHGSVFCIRLPSAPIDKVMG